MLKYPCAIVCLIIYFLQKNVNALTNFIILIDNWEGKMKLIKNATVYTMTDIQPICTDILIKNGKIEKLGNKIDIDNAEIIDARGKLVFPGFIDAHSHVGMWEEAVGYEGIDINEMTDPVMPHLRAIDAINPRDEALRDALEGGVTTACTGPGSANVMGGIFAVIKLHGHRIDDMVINDYYAAKCAFGENPKRLYGQKDKMPMTRMAIAGLLREMLEKAKRYHAKVEAAKGDMSKMPEFDAKCHALLPLMRREIPLKAHAHRADDILTSIRIAKEFNVKLTLDHCTEGHLIAEDLAKEGFPAIVGPTFGGKSKIELTNKSFVTAAALQQAGMKIAIMTDSPVIPLRNLPMCAALAHKAGMDEFEALKAITINAAEILGVNKRLGTIEVGKDADLVIWDKHPFDLMATAEKVFVDGELVVEQTAADFK